MTEDHAESSQPITLTAPLEFNQRSRREFAARLVRSGRITTASGKPGRFIVTTEAIQNAIDRGLFDGLAVFADHPGWFDSPKVKHLIGVTHSSEYNPITDSANATIRFYNHDNEEDADGRLASVIADTLAMMLDDQLDGIPTPDIGVSLVFWPVWKTQHGEEVYPKILDSFHKIDSADIVFGPAADGRILEALSAYEQAEPRSGSRVQGLGFRNQPPTPKPQPLVYGQGGNLMSEPLTPEAANPQLTALDEESTPAKELERKPQSPTPAETINNLDKWQDAAGQEAARAIIAHSQLPEISKEKLFRRHYKTPEQVNLAIEEEREYLAQLTQATVIQLYGGPPRSGSLQMQTGLDHMENAMDWMFGVDGATMPEPQLRRFDMLYSMLTGDYEFHGVFRPERVFLSAANTTTLASLAANAMNKVIMAQLALLTHYRWYEWVALPTPNDGTLQNMQWTSFGGIGTLPVVTEGGAYDELTVDDVKEADTFYKYGGYVGITREMIKNSDIQRIQAVPRALAAASVKTRSSLIAGIFTSASGLGPTLDQDSVALFNAAHGNLLTTALGTDTTAWKAAATECFKHTEVHSTDRIGVFPKYCLVPPDLYHTALSNFGYGEGMPTTYLPFAEDRGVGDPRPLPLAVPHFTDATDWAYIADPRVWPVIHMSFSSDPSGRTFPPPELWAATSETGGLLFAADVLPIKIRDEFAYGVNGFRGIGKRNVAG